MPVESLADLIGAANGDESWYITGLYISFLLTVPTCVEKQHTIAVNFDGAGIERTKRRGGSGFRPACV